MFPSPGLAVGLARGHAACDSTVRWRVCGHAGCRRGSRLRSRRFRRRRLATWTRDAPTRLMPEQKLVVPACPRRGNGHWWRFDRARSTRAQPGISGGRVPGVWAGAVDVVSDGAGGALRRCGRGRWHMNGLRTAGRNEEHFTMVKTQPADDASASRPPSPSGRRAGGPHAPEDITAIGKGVVIEGEVKGARTSSSTARSPGRSSCANVS